MDQQEALELIEAVQQSRFEGAEIEVKAAHRGLPRRLYETMSAFANHPNGGVIILGLDEEQDFAAVGVANPQQRLAELGDMASQMIPPLRLSPIMVNVNDAPHRPDQRNPLCIIRFRIVPNSSEFDGDATERGRPAKDAYRLQAPNRAHRGDGSVD